MSVACPCGKISWSYQIPTGQVCPICGRTYVFWGGVKGGEWNLHPAHQQADRIYETGRDHFLRIERKLASLERMMIKMQLLLIKRRRCRRAHK